MALVQGPGSPGLRKAAELLPGSADEPDSLASTWPSSGLTGIGSLSSVQSPPSPRSRTAKSLGSVRLRPLSKGSFSARGEGSPRRDPHRILSSSKRFDNAPLKEEQRPRPSWHTAPGPAVQLPSSVSKPSAGIPKLDAISTAYLWNPVRVKVHEQKSAMSYGIGTYVNTLSMDVSNRTFQGASSYMMRLAPGNFTAREALWCYTVGENFIICKGIVVGVCPQGHDPANGKDMRIAQLPRGHRPSEPLQFAGLSREAYDVGGHATYSSQLVTLIVLPDGWICGVSSRSVEGAIDLSAIRFCTGKGISLIDDVRLHTCELAGPNGSGTRMVTLQGALSRRDFRKMNCKDLAILPESCRPPSQLAFIVAGTGPGGFHLIIATPSHGFGTGGDLKWRDSIWNSDTINLTGIMYEVAADAVHVATMNANWTRESQWIFVEDFQKFLVRRFGSIELAWHQAFDTDGSGAINFTEFGLGCKMSGFVGNATRLWAALDDDGSGCISLDELGLDAKKFLEGPEEDEQ